MDCLVVNVLQLPYFGFCNVYIRINREYSIDAIGVKVVKTHHGVLIVGSRK